MAEQLPDNIEGMSEEYNKDIDVKDIIHCDPCKDGGIQVKAVGFCVDCNDYLCKECHQAHKRARPSRNHVLKDANSIPKSKTKKERNREKCQEHQNELIHWYCTSHDKCLCDICKHVYHRNCTDVKSITEASQDFLSSDKLKQVSDQLVQLQKSFKENLPRVKKNTEAVESHYAALIEDMIRTFSKIRNEDLERMKALGVTCDTTVKTISSVLNEMETVKQNGDEDQAFVATRKAEMQLRTFGKIFASVVNDNKITKYRYVCKSRSIVDEIIGTICAWKYKSSFTLENVHVKTSTDKVNSHISGIERLSDNRLLIADKSNGKIKLVDMTMNIVKSEVNINYAPWDLTRIADNKIAVTTYARNKIIFVSISGTLTVQNTIDIDTSDFRNCNGIVYSNNSLIVSYTYPHQIHILNLDGTVKQVIEDKDEHGTARFGEIDYLTQGPDTNMLYLSDRSSNKVSIMTLDGQVISSFTHEHLISPRGITVSRDGRIFVCSYNTNKIFEISSDLSEGQVILDETDSIRKPCSILYDEYKVYVGSESTNSVKVFLL